MYLKTYNKYTKSDITLIEYIVKIQTDATIDVFDYRFDQINAMSQPNEIINIRNVEMLRHNVILEFNTINDFPMRWNKFTNKLNDIIPYVIIVGQKRSCLILPISKNVNKFEHDYLADSLAKTLNVERTTKRGFANLELTKLKSQLASAIINNSGKPYEITDGMLNHLKTNEPEKKKDAKINITVDINVLTQSLDRYLEDVGLNELLADNQAIDDLISAIIASESDNLIPKAFEEVVIGKLSQNNKKLSESLSERFKTMRQDLTASSAKLQSSIRIGDVLPLYADSKVQTLAQQFLDTLGTELEPNPEIDLALAGQFISRTYPPHLLDIQGTIRERLVIFNPLTGLWTGDEDVFATLLNTIRPYSTANDLNTMLNTFAAQASAANKLVKPYSGSRYLLFNNGMLDVASKRLHELYSVSVKTKGFIDRTKINLDYIANPPEPKIDNLRLDGTAWSPKDFILAYGNNDAQKTKYLLFGLSLGLFSGHNFGVHFDIQGTSRWGKTTLSELYQSLFCNRVQIISFPELNSNFPFTSYPSNTSVIWIKECNIGAEPLNDEQGTVIYDGLADDQVRFRVKGRGDIVLQNPPQVYIDGTQLIQATEITTGPAGRTLAYVLPNMTDALRTQAYSTDIIQCFRNKSVLQWFVYQMIEIYREVVPNSRINNFKLNLALDNDLKLLPKFAREWRNEFANKATGLGQWFEDSIIPYLNLNKGQETIMHDSILYRLYGEYYAESNPYDTNKNKIMDFNKFQQKLNVSYKQSGLSKKPIGSTSGNRKSPVKRVASRNAMNFDWSGFEAANTVPKEYTAANSSSSQPFGKQKTGWYQITNN